MPPNTLIQITDTAVHLRLPDNRTRRRIVHATLEHGQSPPFFPLEKDDLAPLGAAIGDWLSVQSPDPVVARLVIPSSWVLMQCVQTPDARAAARSAEFEFERFVPLDLESLTCGVQAVAANAALVAGVATAALRGLLEAIESHGARIESVVPDILCVRPAERSAGTTGGRGTVLIDANHLALTAEDTANEAAIHTRSFSLSADGNGDDWKRHLAITLLALRSPPAAWDVFELDSSNAGREVAEHLRSWAPDVTHHDSAETTERIVRTAALTGELPELRTGALAPSDRWHALRRRVATCSLSVAAALLALAVSSHVDGARYDKAAEEIRVRCDVLFRQVFPGHPFVPEAALRTRSERIKLEGLTRPAHEGPDPLGPAGLSILDHLAQAVAHIPKDLKIDVRDLTVDDHGIHFTGRTVSHAAAGDIVKRLNDIPGLRADPPHSTRRDDGTVDFQIHAYREEHVDNP